jgi:hypothetical protein
MSGRCISLSGVASSLIEMLPGDTASESGVRGVERGGERRAGLSATARRAWRAAAACASADSDALGRLAAT